MSEGSGVIHIGSFSKSIAPALRVGYIVARWDILSRMLPLKTDAGSGALEQMVLAEFCARHFTEARAQAHPRPARQARHADGRARRAFRHRGRVRTTADASGISLRARERGGARISAPAEPLQSMTSANSGPVRSSVPPEVLEAIRRKLAVSDRVLNILMTESSLQRPRVVTGVGQREAGNGILARAPILPNKA